MTTGLLPNARYDLMMEAFGGKGYFVQTRQELSKRVAECLQSKKPTLINTMISPHSNKKQQVGGSG